MTIGVLSEIFPPRHGGSGRWLWELYRRLPADKVAFFVGSHPQAEAFDRHHPFPTQRINMEMNAWGARAAWPYARITRQVAAGIRQHRLDALHVARVLPEGLIATALKFTTHTPFACYTHGEELQICQTSREYRWLANTVFRNASAIIANCENTRGILTSIWTVPADRITVLHPGVDTAFFRPADPDPKIRAGLGWSDRQVILTVGRLQKRKGQDCMIRALKRIRESVPGILYSIVGSGEEELPLRQLASREGVEAQVQFVTDSCDVRLLQCYQQCDLFALPNRSIGPDIEGFGMVLVEAQACGKPVLAGDSGGTGETMQAGTTGVIVDCTDPAPVANAVIDLLGNPTRLKTMGRAARFWAVEQFDWDSRAESTNGKLLSFGRGRETKMGQARVPVGPPAWPKVNGRKLQRLDQPSDDIRTS